MEENLKYNLLRYIADQLMEQKYKDWRLRVNDLLEKCESLEFQNIIANIAVKTSDKVTSREFLVRLDQNKKEASIYYK